MNAALHSVQAAFCPLEHRETRQGELANTSGQATMIARKRLLPGKEAD
jgi:hypothetical protein